MLSLPPDSIFNTSRPTMERGSVTIILIMIFPNLNPISHLHMRSSTLAPSAWVLILIKSAVALDYHESEKSNSQRELKRRLELLGNIWGLFENAKEAANTWGRKEGEERWNRK